MRSIMLARIAFQFQMSEPSQHTKTWVRLEGGKILQIPLTWQAFQYFSSLGKLPELLEVNNYDPLKRKQPRLAQVLRYLPKTRQNERLVVFEYLSRLESGDIPTSRWIRTTLPADQQNTIGVSAHISKGNVGSFCEGAVYNFATNITDFRHVRVVVLDYDHYNSGYQGKVYGFTQSTDNTQGLGQLRHDEAGHEWKYHNESTFKVVGYTDWADEAILEKGKALRESDQLRIILTLLFTVNAEAKNRPYQFFNSNNCEGFCETVSESICNAGDWEEGQLDYCQAIAPQLPHCRPVFSEFYVPGAPVSDTSLMATRNHQIRHAIETTRPHIYEIREDSTWAVLTLVGLRFQGMVGNQTGRVLDFLLEGFSLALFFSLAEMRESNLGLSVRLRWCSLLAALYGQNPTRKAFIAISLTACLWFKRPLNTIAQVWLWHPICESFGICGAPSRLFEYLYIKEITITLWVLTYILRLHQRSPFNWRSKKWQDLMLIGVFPIAWCLVHYFRLGKDEAVYLPLAFLVLICILGNNRS